MPRDPAARLKKCCLVLLLCAALSACGEEQDASRGPWQSGEVVALGGGGAGASRACVLCHGLEGQGNGADAPRLAGRDPGYLHRQLDDYASGRRRHAAMAGIARRLSAAERAMAAAYFAGLPPPVLAASAGPAPDAGSKALYHAGDARRGIAPCASCHGDGGEGLGAANPPLAGQPAPYLSRQLRSWRGGERQNDPGHVMQLIARALTAAEIDALSAYAAGLSGAGPRPEPAASP